ncbi:MAG: hypothetical protein V3V75_06460 [Thermoguttaceae bacterium]
MCSGGAFGAASAYCPATGTGKLATELVVGQSPHIDPKPYAITRF